MGRRNAESRAAGMWRCCVSTRGSDGDRRAWPRAVRSGCSNARRAAAPCERSAASQNRGWVTGCRTKWGFCQHEGVSVMIVAYAARQTAAIPSVQTIAHLHVSSPQLDAPRTTPRGVPSDRVERADADRIVVLHARNQHPLPFLHLERIKRTVRRFDEPQVWDPFAGVDRAFAVEIELARRVRHRLAHPVRRDDLIPCLLDARQPLSAPACDVRDQDVLPQV